MVEVSKALKRQRTFLKENPWLKILWRNGKYIYVGSFNNEETAYNSYLKYIEGEYNVK